MNKTFLAVLSVLTVLILSMIFFYDANPSTDKNIESDFNTNNADITRVELFHNGETLTFELVNDTWLLDEYPVDTAIINNLVNDFQYLLGDRVVSNNESKQEKFSVTDSSSALKLFDNEGQISLDLIVGTLGASAKETIVRQRGSKEIVTIRKNLRQYLQNLKPHFWDKHIVNFEATSIKSLTFVGDAGAYECAHLDTAWVMDNNKIDDAIMRPLLSVFRNLTATNFSNEAEIADAHKVGEVTVGLITGETSKMEFYTKPQRDTVVWIRLSGNSKIIETSISRVNKLFKSSSDF